MVYIHKIFDAISGDKDGDGIESIKIMREANVAPKLYY
jgi:hypothetical protein